MGASLSKRLRNSLVQRRMSGERGQEKWPEAGEPCAGHLRWPRDETAVPVGKPKSQVLMLMSLMLLLQKLLSMLWV